MSGLDQFGAIGVAQGSQTGGFGEIAERWVNRLAGEIRAAGLPLNSASSVLENSRVVKAGPGTLFGFTVYNNKGAAQFIQWFDSQTVPANGAVPQGVISVATIASQGVAWVIPGRFFAAGIILANSSTAATLTAGSADCFFDAQYI